MLTVSNLTYKIGARTILDNCNVTVMDGWKVGVIGQNGAGKSTLFKLIAGELQADGGTVALPAHQRLGMVRQDIPETDTPLIDIVLAADEEMAQLWKDAETETDPNQIADIYEKLANMDAYAAPSRAAQLLTGLGFKEDQLQEPFSSFSGGWRMRVALAAALFVEPEVLLLDEPTNHLDLEAIMWLESYLADYPHTLLIISHDREVLNRCIDHVIHVDKKQVSLYTGNYDTFERERAEKLGLQQKIFEKQQAERAHMQKFIDRFKAQASKARQAQSRIKALERMDIVDAVIADRAVRFTFPNPDKIPSPMLSIENASVGYSEGNPIISKIHESISREDRIAILGANGNGKSTMMKLIAGKLNISKGDIFRSNKLRIGYFSQHQTEELNVDATPYEEMMTLMRQKNPDITEPAVRAKLGAFGFSKPLADNKISTLSGGEKARLLFAFMSFDAPHLLLLDEPTNHLDIDAREALVHALNSYEGAIIIVSHDPNMIERVADQLWLVKDKACTHFDGNLEDYRKFIIKSSREERKNDKKEKNKEDFKNSISSNSTEKIDLSKAEKKISDLEREKKKLEEIMNSPEFFKKGTEEIIKIQNKYEKISNDLEKYELLWLEVQVA